MKREKFTTRSIRLVSEYQRETAIALMKHLPVDPDNPIQIMVREEPKARGLDQNGLYWLRLGEIATQAWLNNRQFDADSWHHYAGRKWMPETITTKDGEVRSKWVESPDGSVDIISTTKLERSCFANYTNIVEAEGASLGVEFSVNPRELARAA